MDGCVVAPQTLRQVAQFLDAGRFGIGEPSIQSIRPPLPHHRKKALAQRDRLIDRGVVCAERPPIGRYGVTFDSTTAPLSTRRPSPVRKALSAR